MTVTMPPEEFFAEHVRLLERIESRGFADNDDVIDGMRLLGLLYGAGSLRMSVTAAERDVLAGVIVCSVVTGQLDEEAVIDLQTTRAYLADQ